MTFMDRINAALVRYLLEVRSIEAVEAEFDTTDSGTFAGCDTCGNGAGETTFDIRYKLYNDFHWRFHTEDGDPLQFLPTLLAFDTEEI